MNQVIFVTAFCLMYFNICGLATTNILRLTFGNKLPILSSKCNCDNCGSRITPVLQLPIVSFIICKGKCKSCGIKLPVDALLLEISVLFGMLLTSAVFSFSWLGIICSFLYYELVRLVMILLKGKRENEFVKQYVIAVASMLPYYIVASFVSLLYGVVC